MGFAETMILDSEPTIQMSPPIQNSLGNGYNTMNFELLKVLSSSRTCTYSRSGKVNTGHTPS